MIELRVVVDGCRPATRGRESRRASSPNEPVTASSCGRAAERRAPAAARGARRRDRGLRHRATVRASAGRAFIAARVLPEHRRRGVGTALVRALVEHARALGRERRERVRRRRRAGLGRVRRAHGLDEVDYQLEQVRGDRRRAGAADACPRGIELVPLGDRRDELLRAAWPLAERGVRRHARCPARLVYRSRPGCATRRRVPEGSFVALELGRVVGYAGLRRACERRRDGRARPDRRSPRPPPPRHRARPEAGAARTGRRRRRARARHVDAAAATRRCRR